MKKTEQQTSLLEQFQRRQRRTLKYEFDRKQAWLLENFEMIEHAGLYTSRMQLKEGTEIIVEFPGWTPDERIKATRYYRTVLGFHQTVSGIEPDLRWQPSEEFPDEPPWSTFDGTDQKWTYPGWPLILWRRRKPNANGPKALSG